MLLRARACGRLGTKLDAWYLDKALKRAATAAVAALFPASVRDGTKGPLVVADEPRGRADAPEATSPEILSP